MVSIEPSLIKLWNLACKPDLLEIVDTSEVVNLDKLPMQTANLENFFYLLAAM